MSRDVEHISLYGTQTINNASFFPRARMLLFFLHSPRPQRWHPRAAHRLWCRAAGHFLYTLYHPDQDYDPHRPMPDDRPARGRPLPTISKPIGQKYSNLTQTAQTAHSTLSAQHIGKLRFLRNSLQHISKAFPDDHPYDQWQRIDAKFGSNIIDGHLKDIAKYATKHQSPAALRRRNCPWPASAA